MTGQADAVAEAASEGSGALRTRVYREGEIVAENVALTDLSEFLADPEMLVWVDFCAPSKEQLHTLADELGLHELAVEDALGPDQRPKLDYYESHRFLSCYAVKVDSGAGELVETEIAAFIDSHWLVTVRKNDAFDIDHVVRRWERSPELVAHGVSFLVYGLIDIITDGYFDALQVFDDYYENVSDELFGGKPLDPQRQRHWFDMRRALVRFHRLAVPMREAISSLMRRDTHAVSGELYPYYQDAYDHSLRVTESLESMRDLVGTIVETSLTLREYRQNQIVKLVSSWAAIVAVPAMITGYFGMNVPYPGSGDTSGFIVSSALIAVMSVALYVLFRKRDWL